MSRGAACFLVAPFLLLVPTACSDATVAPDAPLAPPPVLRSLTPSEVEPGEPGLVLRVSGEGFTSLSVVRWNGLARPTRFVDASLLEAQIPATDLVASGAFAVTVADPGATGPSQPLPFTVLAPVVDPALADLGLIQTGYVFSCGVSADGRVHCWGENSRGTLGNGTLFGDPTFVPALVDATVPFRQVTIGARMDGGTPDQTACGLAEDGRAFCWGGNYGGSAGGADMYSPVVRPTEVQGGLHFDALDAGSEHVCGVTPEGNAYCWGDGYDGQLGDGQGGTPGPGGGHQSARPLRVIWPAPFRSVAAGDMHTCALTMAGEAVCWGSPRYVGIGQGMPGTTPAVTGPVKVASDWTFAALDAGVSSTCGLTAYGRTVCWGSLSLTGSVEPPRAMIGWPRLKSISVGYQHACGLDAQGGAWCWGVNQWGQLGTGEVGGELTLPAAVAGGHRFVSIDAGVVTTCGVTVDGRGLCWGRKGLGRLGDGNGEVRLSPSPVAGGHAFVDLDGFCGLTREGKAWCWGPLPEYSIGVALSSPEDARLTPHPLSGDALLSITSGDARRCGLAADGSVRCTTSGGTTLLPEAEGWTFKALVGGWDHLCGLDAQGGAWCWGANQWGQLGDGTATPRAAPTKVSGGHQFRELGAEGSSTCGLDTRGEAWCWGSNGSGEVGPGARSETCIAPKSIPVHCSRVPVPAAPGYSFRALVKGRGLTCGVGSDGRHRCWGAHEGGADWCGSQYMWHGRCTLNPFDLAPGISFKDVSLQATHRCGVTADGAVLCWGANEYGRLGNGTYGKAEAAPAPVLGGTAFASVETSAYTTCALTPEGAAWCWGAAAGGQTGDGIGPWQATPVQVFGLTFGVPLRARDRTPEPGG